MEILLKRLNDAGVRYVVIGGQAMLQQGMPRFTLDWDIFVPPGSDAAFKTAVQRQMTIRATLLIARIVKNPVH